MYLLFAGQDYYGCGGANDFVGSFKTLEEAIQKAEKIRDTEKITLQYNADWCNILNIETNEIEYSYGEDYSMPHNSDLGYFHELKKQSKL